MRIKLIGDGYSDRMALPPEHSDKAVVRADCPVCGRNFIAAVVGERGRPARFCSQSCKRFSDAVDRVEALRESVDGAHVRPQLVHRLLYVALDLDPALLGKSDEKMTG